MKPHLATALALVAVFACGRDRQPAPTAWLRVAAEAALLQTPASDSHGVSADAERDLVLLPAGERLELALFARAGTELRFERIAPRGAELAVGIETDERGPQELGVFAAPAADLSLPLGVEGGQPVRLVLEARPADNEPPAERTGDGDVMRRGVVIRGAALWAPPPAANDAEAAQTATSEIATSEIAPAALSPPPDIVLYLIDTLRSDRLGARRNELPVTPHLDELAERATVFRRAVGQSSWTKASVASMFTGLWPPAHGAIGHDDKLPSDLDTVAERLKAAGYSTAGFVTNPNVTPLFGFGQGFDDYLVEIDVPSARVNEMVFDWLRSRPEGPFFLYVHTLDPHGPYLPPEPFRSRFVPEAGDLPEPREGVPWRSAARPHLRGLYDAEIAANDHSFGELVEFLEAEGLFHDSLLLVISDHGEEFKEHGQWGHGKNLHAESLDFPWIIKFPGQTEGRSIERPVQHVDLLPTILEQAGLPFDDGLGGRSLGGALPHRRPLYSHLRLRNRPQAHSVVDGDWKLIRTRTRDNPRILLFDLGNDPGEKRNLAGELPVRAAALEALLDKKIRTSSRSGPAEKAEIDAEVERSLRALGYLQ